MIRLLDQFHALKDYVECHADSRGVDRFLTCRAARLGQYNRPILGSSSGKLDVIYITEGLIFLDLDYGIKMVARPVVFRMLWHRFNATAYSAWDT